MKNILKSIGLTFVLAFILAFSAILVASADVTNSFWIKGSNGQLYTNSGNGQGNAIINVAGCNGCGGGGGITIGDIVSGGTPTEVLYTSNSGNLFSDSLFTRNSSTNVTNILREFQKLTPTAEVVTNTMFIVENATGNFTVGETITGGTSGSTAVVAYSDVLVSGILLVDSVSAPFTNAELITGGTSGETGDYAGLFTPLNVGDTVVIFDFALGPVGSGTVTGAITGGFEIISSVTINANNAILKQDFTAGNGVVSATPGTPLTTDFTTGFISDLVSGKNATLLDITDENGNTAKSGVRDMSDNLNYSFSPTTAVMSSSDTDGNSSNIYVSQLQSVFESEYASGAITALRFSENSFELGRRTSGGSSRYFYANDQTIGWKRSNTRFNLPVNATPNIGDVITVTSVSSDDVVLDFQTPAGGGSPGGSTYDIQVNNAGVFTAASSNSFQYNLDNGSFNANTIYLSSILGAGFTGGGLNDMSTSGTYTGDTNATYIVEIDGFQDTMTYDTLAGGTFGIGQVVTGSVSGAEASIEIDDGSGEMIVIITNGIHFAAGDVIDNGFGVTANYLSTTLSKDTFKWSKNNVVGTFYTVISVGDHFLSDGVIVSFGSDTGHTYGNYWTFTAVQLQQTKLVTSEYYIDIPGLLTNTPSYINGSVQVNNAFGIKSFNGLWQSINNTGYTVFPMMHISNSIAGYNGYSGFITEQSYRTQITGDGFTTGFTLTNDSFSILGQTNGTGITVDDLTQLITISNVPTYADDAAATTAGLTTGQLYKTTTSGVTALNIVP